MSMKRRNATYSCITSQAIQCTNARVHHDYNLGILPYETPWIQTCYLLCLLVRHTTTRISTTHMSVYAMGSIRLSPAECTKRHMNQFS